MKKWIVGVSVLVAATLIACGSDNKPDDADVNRLNDNAASTEASALPAKPVERVITAGDWEVGNKENLNAGVITTGVYVITSPTDSFGCTWETVRNFSGEGNYLISVGNVDAGKTGRVEIKSSVKGLKLEGDCLAKKK